jgi:peptidoglycan/xylan/chitin deacetylase (PgdA/CDA1 family)
MLAIITGGTIGALIVLFMLYWIWYTRVVCLIKLAKFRGSRAKQIVGLSFDDGPDWGEEQLIKALNKAEIEATFFWIWEKVEKLDFQDHQRFVNLLQLLNQGKHEVGIHALKCTIRPGCTCKRIMGYTSSDIYSDIIKAQQNFHCLLNSKPLLYRPHGVQVSRKLSEAIVKSKVEFVVGTIRLAIGPSRKNIGKKYEENFARARRRDIICGHDSCDCSTDFGIACDIARVVPRIKKIMVSKGLQIGTVYQALH